MFKRYKVYRPFGRECGLLNASITVIIWFLMATYNLVETICNVVMYDIEFIYNYIHFRKINYNFNEIEKMIRNMNPREFEEFIAELYKKLGYRVELTSETSDGGKDVILYDTKRKKKIYVECKHYAKNNLVGREICQKLLGAMYADKIDEGIIVTTGGFHRNALMIQNKVNNLEFVDMKKILNLIRKLNVHEVPRLFMRRKFVV